MAKAPIWQWSAIETAKAIRSRKISSEEVTKAHIDRMKAVNPKLNAVVVDLSKDAIKAARAADKALAKGQDVGPLHGVPVTIKINLDVEGQANSNGVVAFKDNIAPGDSPVTANLKKAGAVIVGLTNTPEFSMRAFTDNPLHGLTLNPWDDKITCGGSSGGAGSAVAAGIGCIAHGNDIGGSLRWPAYCNGVATIKPTLGRIPAFNPSMLKGEERGLMAQFMSSQGPLARSVADVRLGMEVMAQRDMRDPWWVPAPLKGPKLKGPIKVAVAKIPKDMQADRQVISLVRKAADHLADAGYDVREVEVPDLDGTWKLWCDLIMTELHVLQEKVMRQTGGKDFVQTMEGFLKTATMLDGEAYMKAIAQRSRVLRNWLAFLEDYPVLLTPLSVNPTPPTNEDLKGDARVKELFWNDLRFMSVMNLLGLPAAVVPVGLVKGNPVGVQIVASRYREDVCLDAAVAIEKKAGIVVKELWARD
ncbi:amidase family protein [Phreatobacter sp.]|uniref:amidase family protein n=1 Tax=Phreatobacter sp. TaxID=1966341 RepID=UPI00345D51D9